LTHYQLT